MSNVSGVLQAVTGYVLNLELEHINRKRMSVIIWLATYGNLCLWIQPVDATAWLKHSAGVEYPRVFLGRSFNCRATSSSSSCE